MDQKYYFDTLPQEVIESIVYPLDCSSLKNFVSVISRERNITTLDYSTVHFYRFGIYKQVSYHDYLMCISLQLFLEYLKSDNK